MTHTSHSIIDKFSRVHSTRYDYGKMIYTTASNKIEIICGIHGSFWQTPKNHYNGNGCPLCSNHIGGKAPLSVAEVRRRFESLHGDTYAYDSLDVTYRGIHHKLPILCHRHGTFWQTPKNHMRGKGCPFCAARGPKGLIVYVMEFTSEQEHWVKIGIMHDSLDRRYPGLRRKGVVKLLHVMKCIDVDQARLLERYLLHSTLSYQDPSLGSIMDTNTNWKGRSEIRHSTCIEHLVKILNVRPNNGINLEGGDHNSELPAFVTNAA